MIEYSPVIIDRNYIIYAIEQWGTSFSIALLDPACSFFKVPTLDGLIGYRKIGNCIVVFGEPICPPDNLADLMCAFNAYCAEQSSNVVYIAASEVFTTMALQSQYVRGSLQLINEIVINPLEDPMARKGKKASLLRNKYNQAIRHGLEVKEYPGNDPSIEKDLERIGSDWMKARKGPQIYLFSGTLFTDRANKRWFYAEHNKSIIAVAMLNRIGATSGWVLNIIIVKPEALSITSEFMLIRILEVLRGEGCTFFSIGPSPAERLVNINGFNKVISFLARWAFYILGAKIFRLSNRQRYWDKFYPQKKPSFVLFGKARIGLPEVLGIMRAMNVNI